ncbi:hypothetical protein GGF43_001035 [Coemansia sp. RSA 2618]|nr:hypothetical protein GGF43_001035 [Coemansia sp. RSA 2618]
MTSFRPTKRLLALLTVVLVAFIHFAFKWRPLLAPPPHKLEEGPPLNGLGKGPNNELNDELNNELNNELDNGPENVPLRTEYPSIIHHHTPPPAPQWPLLDKLFGTARPPPPLLCSEIPVPERYWSAQDAFTPAFVTIPNNRVLQVGASVCVRVVVPAKPARSSVLYTPMPGTPWDSILLDLIGLESNISVPVRLQMTQDIRNTQRDAVHVYEADVVLRDADEYAVRGYIEFRDAEWNPDGGLVPVEYEPEMLHIPELLTVQVADDGSSIYSLARHMELPLCADAGGDGRWVRADRLPFDTDQLPEPENHGLVWLPYTCRLRRVSYSEFVSCLSTGYPLMHWYGDSNLRRALKKITTLGEWCTNNATHYNSTETRSCLCEDYRDVFLPFDSRYRELVIDVDETGGRTLKTAADISRVPERTARVYLHKWEGLSARNKPGWLQAFDGGVTARFGQPQVALISLTNWDAAFSSRAYFAVEMQRLLDVIAREYSPQTQLVIRTGQYYCCRTDKTPRAPRSYSRLRNAYFDQYVIDAFRERFGATHRISVWDVSRVAERLPFDVRKENVKCPANHVRAELVEIENQVLMNAMCNHVEPYTPIDVVSESHLSTTAN